MNLQQQQTRRSVTLLSTVPEHDAENEPIPFEIASTSLLSSPQKNHLLRPYSNQENYAKTSEKSGYHEEQHYHQQQYPSSSPHQHVRRSGRRTSFIRRLSAAIPSLSADPIPFAAVSFIRHTYFLFF
ncbi:unnamed protein product [Gongylonema pulchrum]|uniref:Uncharacterized protein n=1 Tax=Gongylonema pulchrum TaxID=637853 RepID=A0A183CYW3_9BILA|nr:unnamed protein product [Gongylonema pulchrum]